jgi:hypothetical protein
MKYRANVCFGRGTVVVVLVGAFVVEVLGDVVVVDVRAVDGPPHAARATTSAAIEITIADRGREQRPESLIVPTHRSVAGTVAQWPIPSEVRRSSCPSCPRMPS